MRAAPDLMRQRAQNLAVGNVVEMDDVKEAVGKVGVWGHVHAAAKVAAVGDRAGVGAVDGAVGVIGCRHADR